MARPGSSGEQGKEHERRERKELHYCIFHFSNFHFSPLQLCRGDVGFPARQTLSAGIRRIKLGTRSVSERVGIVGCMRPAKLARGSADDDFGRSVAELGGWSVSA